MKHPIMAGLLGLVLSHGLAHATLTRENTAPAEAIQESLTRLAAERLVNAEEEPGNWMLHGRTYGEDRYSPLKQINDQTVANLGLAWAWETGTNRGLEATPIVVDGVMYVTGSWSEVYAIDARNGTLLWRNDLDVDKTRGQYACCDVVNRGVAVWNGKVYVGTIDGRLVALDAVTGEIVWDVVTIDKSRPYTITGAPRIVKGNVIIGNGGAEFGVRGYITAYDVETGEQKWRFYTVPGNPADGFESDALKMAAETWGGGPWWEIGGGGTVWDSMAYDPELDLLYIGVGNGAPWNKHIRSPAGGDNLFLSSIVAIKPETGEYVWHYQTTPGEGWDYTATQHIILTDLTIDGQQRKVLMQAPKNGFFYVIDRETGKFISADNYVPVSWAEGIDPETGRPIQTNNSYERWPKLQLPSPLGGHNWMPMCLSRDTGYVYIPSQEMAMLYDNDTEFEYIPGYWNTGMKVMKDVVFPAWIDHDLVMALGAKAAKGYLQAWDPVNQRQVWKVEHEGLWNGGVLCTAGNLVMQGNGKGYFAAYAADTGHKLWEFDAQNGIVAPPVTYEIDGEQYISVLAGWGGSVGLSFGMVGNVRENMYPYGRLLTFKLNGKESLPPVQVTKKLPEPMDLEADGDLIAKGDKLYHHNCVYCHGPGAISNPNMVDLRRMDAETHENFIAIVLGGRDAHKTGMIGFSDHLSVEDVQAIHAYLNKVGENTLEREQASGFWKTFKGAIYSVLGAITSFFVSIFNWIMNAGS
ncbi:PQQ-dependent dehydrogenase, methanol/ethanol family [Candidatus Macondimonas diazotrophica]|nr:PQQ-dependent dehydrogenase, methanol/ethanol family [Candidatus Macondimonas diazotrophica]